MEEPHLHDAAQSAKYGAGVQEQTTHAWHTTHTHTETDAHIPHKGPKRFKAMLSGWSASSQGGDNAARAISPNMETDWRRVRIYGPQVSSYRPGALSDAGLMGNGFYMPHWFPEQTQ